MSSLVTPEARGSRIYVDSVTGKPVTQPIYTLEEFAARERVSAATVRVWRMKGQDPVSFKAGKHVRYRLEDVERWEREQIENQNTTEKATA